MKNIECKKNLKKGEEEEEEEEEEEITIRKQNPKKLNEILKRFMEIWWRWVSITNLLID